MFSCVDASVSPTPNLLTQIQGKTVLKDPFKESTPIQEIGTLTKLKGSLISHLFGASLSSFFGSKPEPMEERILAQKSPNNAKWKLHWRTPLLLAVTFVAGISVALAQHFLYSSIHYKTEDNEEKKIRSVLYGRALAYAAKVAFGECILLCYRQRIWRTFRERALSIRSIDQLFTANSDPSLFLDWETISNAPLPTVIALVIWLVPLLTVILSPSALSYGWHIEHSSASILVPTVNFSMESINDWRHPMYSADGTRKRSLLYYNTTDKTATSKGWFDYYDEPNTEIRNLTYRNIYNTPKAILDNALNRDIARQRSCGGNFNCTYTTAFLGPGYKCEKMANGIGDNEKVARANGPFNTSMLAPEGPYLYHAEVDIRDYLRPQADNLSLGGAPSGLIPDHLGSIMTEPVLWIGYSIDTSNNLRMSSTMNGTHPHIFRCLHYETRYTVKWNYTGASYKIDSSSEFLTPVINTTVSCTGDLVEPPENFISPRKDVYLYKKTAAYHAVGQVFRKFLSGDIIDLQSKTVPNAIGVQSDILETNVLSTQGNYTIIRPNPHEKLSNFYKDIVISLFSQPQMIVYSEDRVLVNRTRLQQGFIYKPFRLWACYTPIILLTFIFLISGAWAIWEDGTTFSVGFSRIMATTRNPTLDLITQGACLGNDPFPKELTERKLKFGALQEKFGLEYIGTDSDHVQSVGHCAFGLSTEVGPIQRGALYAGLGQIRRKKAPGKEKLD